MSNAFRPDIGKGYKQPFFTMKFWTLPLTRGFKSVWSFKMENSKSLRLASNHKVDSVMFGLNHKKLRPK